MTKQLKSAILKKARFLAAPEMKTIEIGVVGKFVTVKVLNSYGYFTGHFAFHGACEMEK